ncbi:unnamed protein product [Cuscuta europaea]|uniref:DUF8039 domain-containing protein n=1 Tax=Cuscuta europaea TaxID=41803 RepID=A0A9P0ZXU6_CUSEU|nr:unnamed protein product [Cuscuta europaea]
MMLLQGRGSHTDDMIFLPRYLRILIILDVYAVLEEVWGKIQDQWMNDMEKAFAQRGFQSTTFPSTHSQTVDADTMNSTAPIPRFFVVDGSSCKLAVESQAEDGHKDLKYVAMALAYNNALGAMIHNIPMSANTIKVNISMIYTGFEQCPLLVPNEIAEIYVLTDAIGSFVEWPSHLVFLKERAYRVASARNGDGKPITWHNVKYARQNGNTECGYYTMRYIWEVISYVDSFDIGKDWFSRTEAYSEDEFNNIRNIWARFFLDVLLNM